MSDTPIPGTVLAQKYRIDSELRRGGDGLILSATHLANEKVVAIKMLRREHGADVVVIESFFRGTRFLAAIKKSAHVVRTFDMNRTDEGFPFIVMERLEGLDLARLVAQRGPVPPRDAARYVFEACDALAEAHGMGILHRDLKPGHLFLADRAEGPASIKVLDFGRGSKAGEHSARPARMEHAALFDPPYFKAPEQFRDFAVIDARTDVWALGAILHTLVRGEPPFPGANKGNVTMAIEQKAPPPLEDAGLDAIVRRCLEKESAKRFASVGELAAALAG